MPSGGRNVASVGFAPIEELSSKAEVLSDPNFNFQGFTEWMQSRRQETPKRPPNTSSNFDITSTTFLHLLGQQRHDADPNATGGEASGAGLQTILNKAIHAYETTASVISGQPLRRGVNVSLAL
jgi:hypothetical protein